MVSEHEQKYMLYIRKINAVLFYNMQYEGWSLDVGTVNPRYNDSICSQRRCH